MRILVLGVSGMLGSVMFRSLWDEKEYDVYGCSRSFLSQKYFNDAMLNKIVSGVDVNDNDSLLRLFVRVKPQVIINCVGLIKQLSLANDALCALPINSVLPHRLARLCELLGTRLIHVSTDCVFSGGKGNYVETDVPDAEDLYGRSKYLGEVSYPHTVTLRTSIIGHELRSSYALVDWFLKQEGFVKGYTRAFFSGLPTIELSRIIRDIVLHKADLSGLYHVASTRISKYDLLSLIASVYKKKIKIIPDDHVSIDRSLNADLFNQVTGYVAPAWPELVHRMYRSK